MSLFYPIQHWKPSDAIRFPTINVWGVPLLSVKLTIHASNRHLDCVKMTVHPTVTVAELTRRLAEIRTTTGRRFCKETAKIVNQEDALDREMPLWLSGIVAKNNECWIRVE